MTTAAEGPAGVARAADPAAGGGGVLVSFQTDPSRYRHWRLAADGPVATLTMDVAEDGGLRDGYELKLNSYDLGVDIELHDAVQRLRFEHPQVRAVVVTSGKEKIFCAGANIRMLAQSPHPWKVNFCKFTNETRNGIEDATAFSGQTYVAALNGTASGGGYELALACDHIMLIDDRSSVVSLPELPLLGVLPGTGGLTRVTDKRHVRHDLADYFATRSEGVGGRKAVAWRLVDEAVPRTRWEETVAARSGELAASSARPRDAAGIVLTPLDKARTGDTICYRHVSARLDRRRGEAAITVRGPEHDPPADASGIHDQGAAFWSLAVTRELDDLILDLRTNELELGTWVLRTEGDPRLVMAYDRLLLGSTGDWLVNEIVLFMKRTLKRLDVTSRSLIALIEPGSCFAGSLLELALAADRSYMLAGVFEDTASPDPAAPPRDPEAAPAAVAVNEMNTGPLPMGNGLTRLQTRFFGDPESLAAAQKRAGEFLGAEDAEDLGLVTFAPDDLDWDEEVRIAVEERSSFSPDALSGMEANYRFAGPETMETKIFGRLSAWQNWIFTRPNASGPEGALRKYGTGQRASFDQTRV
jgi:benzoyl-CoA-dihydrodiol lyase